MFLDLSKAFDLVGHSTLHCRFIVNFNYLGFTYSMQKCYVDGKLSDSYKISCRIPQDSVCLNHQMYFIYNNDCFPTCLSTQKQEHTLMLTTTVSNNSLNIVVFMKNTRSSVAEIQPILTQTLTLIQIKINSKRRN